MVTDVVVSESPPSKVHRQREPLVLHLLSDSPISLCAVSWGATHPRKVATRTVTHQVEIGEAEASFQERAWTLLTFKWVMANSPALVALLAVALGIAFCRPSPRRPAPAQRLHAPAAQAPAAQAPAAQAPAAQALQECIICQTEFAANDGCPCPAGTHFVCWPCLRGMAQHRYLRCPERLCGVFFDHQHAFRQPNGEGKEAALQDILELVIQNEVRERDAERRRQQEAEERAIMEHDDPIERTSRRILLEVREQILCLRCPWPGCRQVFGDFNACTALQCSNCTKMFCGWCLMALQSDPDPHIHVLDCPENKRPADVFAPMGEWRQHHAERKQRLINRRLADETPQVRRRVLELVAAEL